MGGMGRAFDGSYAEYTCAPQACVFPIESDLAWAVLGTIPEIVDRVLELVGTTTLLDSLQCATPGGIVYMTGILGNAWALNNFSPMNDIPQTVRLTVYTGESKDLSVEQLQRFIDGVAAGQRRVNIDRIFHLGEIVEAHYYMESNQATRKLVVLVNELKEEGDRDR
jgi:NADPH:quinone reductase